MARTAERRNPFQEEQRAITRAAITTAAAKIFAEHGYVGCSIEQILVAAGVSRTAFYSHFVGKLAVVQAIAADFESAWLPVFHHLADLRDPDLPALVQWASSHLKQHRDNFEICSLLTQVAALEELLYWQISAQRDALIGMLAASHPAFAAAQRDSGMMLEAHILLGSIDQTCFHVVRQHLPDPAGRAPQIIARQMLDFLRRPTDHLDQSATSTCPADGHVS